MFSEIRLSESLRRYQNSHPIHIQFTPLLTTLRPRVAQIKGDTESVREESASSSCARHGGAGRSRSGLCHSCSGDNSSEPQGMGSGIEKAKSIALDYTNAGRVSGTEISDEEEYYEVEVIRGDGSQVDVHLDRDYNVLSMPADHEGSDSKDASNDSG